MAVLNGTCQGCGRSNVIIGDEDFLCSTCVRIKSLEEKMNKLNKLKAEASYEVLEDMEMLVDEYALADDKELTTGAIELKNDVITMVEKLYRKINPE